jgi:hypothetical protein
MPRAHPPRHRRRRALASRSSPSSSSPHEASYSLMTSAIATPSAPIPAISRSVGHSRRALPGRNFPNMTASRFMPHSPRELHRWPPKWPPKLPCPRRDDATAQPRAPDLDVAPAGTSILDRHAGCAAQNLARTSGGDGTGGAAVETISPLSSPKAGARRTVSPRRSCSPPGWGRTHRGSSTRSTRAPNEGRCPG